MGLIKRLRADTPAQAAKLEKATKKHCKPCNGVGTVQQRDYDQGPNKVGSYPIVDVRCKNCNGQGWTAVT